jgi:hypothetical protein
MNDDDDNDNQLLKYTDLKQELIRTWQMKSPMPYHHYYPHWNIITNK